MFLKPEELDENSDLEYYPRPTDSESLGISPKSVFNLYSRWLLYFYIWDYAHMRHNRNSEKYVLFN